MRAVDTNIVVRIIVRDDSQQAEAAESFIEESAWVSIPVLLQSLWTLGSAYGQDSKSLAQTIEMLLTHDRLVLQDSDAVASALEQFRARPSLGFADCLILSLARKAGHLPLGTFDRKLAKLPGAQRL
jgi:predicted nucleic-acid-binding protein